jgi:uncharacterized protein (DUF952 family)
MATPMRNPDFVYKIAARPAVEAAAAAGKFPRMPIDDKDGYIHFSTAEQLAETLRLYFAGQGNLVLLAVRPIEMGAGLRWEPSRGGQLFPHHYGELGWSAVANRVRIDVAPDGSVTLPAWVK